MFHVKKIRIEEKYYPKLVNPTNVNRYIKIGKWQI